MEAGVKRKYKKPATNASPVVCAAKLLGNSIPIRSTLFYAFESM
jgi:hypothetical protein